MLYESSSNNRSNMFHRFLYFFFLFLLVTNEYISVWNCLKIVRKISVTPISERIVHRSRCCIGKKEKERNVLCITQLCVFSSDFLRESRMESNKLNDDQVRWISFLNVAIKASTMKASTMTALTRIKIIRARVLASCLKLFARISRRFIWLPTGRGVSKSRFPRCFSAIRVFVAWEIIIHNRRKRLVYETRVSISLLIRNCLIIIANGIVDWQANRLYFSLRLVVESFEKGFENNFLSAQIEFFFLFFFFPIKDSFLVKSYRRIIW